MVKTSVQHLLAIVAKGPVTEIGVRFLPNIQRVMPSDIQSNCFGVKDLFVTVESYTYTRTSSNLMVVVDG